MNIEIKSELLKEFIKKTGNQSKLLAQKAEYSWRNNDRVRVPIDGLRPDDLAKLQEWLSAKSKSDKSVLGAIRKIATYQNLKADPTGSEVTGLEPLVTALKNYIVTSQHKWLFSEEADGHLCPYYVDGIEFHPHRAETPASTRLSMIAINRGEQSVRHITWHASDLLGKTSKRRNVVKLLQDEGYFLETPDVVALYCEELAAYKEVKDQTGEQFVANGLGFSKSGGRWWRSGTVSLERDGVPSKVVVDDRAGVDEDDEERSSGYGRNRSRKDVVDGRFWKTKNDSEEIQVDEGVENDLTVALPVHPYIQVFELEKHRYTDVHVSNLSAYQYDESMFDKLVLPKDVKDLVHILVQGSSENMDDIVKGKTGGTIVIATGPPGTGKTLTAEVFSEAVKRPLYVVQCSQLGTDESSLEKHLTLVLARSTRWKAILLIDEADVYVHERGADIQQNAIVGVFLRVLEYYNGILFMTSNRATVIDDAIMSRATAWIQYDVPRGDEQIRIWRILSEQFGIMIPKETLTELAREGIRKRGQAVDLTGRNIKNLLKLAKRLSAATGKPIDFQMLSDVARFLDLGAG